MSLRAQISSKRCQSVELRASRDNLEPEDNPGASHASSTAGRSRRRGSQRAGRALAMAVVGIRTVGPMFVRSCQPVDSALSYTSGGCSKGANDGGPMTPPAPPPKCTHATIDPRL